MPDSRVGVADCLGEAAQVSAISRQTRIRKRQIVTSVGEMSGAWHKAGKLFGSGAAVERPGHDAAVPNC